MKRILVVLMAVVLGLQVHAQAPSQADTGSSHIGITEGNEQGIEDVVSSAPENEIPDAEEAHGSNLPAAWSVIPFVLLLVMIATGPLFYPHFWHHRYPVVAALLGAIVVIYYLAALHNAHQPLHSLQEYISFIALLTALFVASGGILIKVDRAGTPMVNVMLLVIGAIVANIIGTTGASMLLIRPFIRLNKDRIKAYHIVFFIFIVSNVGGALTPIGDPPLFLGFLKGVPFFWTIQHLIVKWSMGIGLLAAIFWFIDRRNHAHYYDPEGVPQYTGKIMIQGARNIFFLAITIGAVFLDPGVMEWLPTLILTEHGLVFTSLSHFTLHSHDIVFSFWREAIMFGAAFAAFRTSDPVALKGNEFDFEPIKEVAFLFIGIFATMMPALQLIASFAGSEAGSQLINIHSLYWTTGALSGVLDNAPTYLNFLSAGMGNVCDSGTCLDIAQKQDVLLYSVTNIPELAAISIAAVFFGAMTYIGNAPNFMVKSIAEQVGIQMPSFVGYIIRYSIPILLPVLFITWLVYFVIF